MTREEFTKRASTCKPTNREKVEHLLTELYKECDWKPFSYIVYHASPARWGNDTQYGGKSTYLHGRYTSVKTKATQRIDALRALFLGEQKAGSYRAGTPMEHPIHGSTAGLVLMTQPPVNQVKVGEIKVQKSAAFTFDSSAADTIPLVQSLRKEANTKVKEAQKRAEEAIKPIEEELVLSEKPKALKIYEQLHDEVLDFYPGVDVLHVLEKPAEIHNNAAGNLHNEDGAAIVWKDGRREYKWDGVDITRRFIEEPPTLAYISRQTNMERRRILIQRYGEEKYLKDRKAKLMHKDETGELYRIKTPNRHWPSTSPLNEDFVMVKVINSTPEPDGTRRTFFLRVPPTMRTAKEAVAWSFKQNEKAYTPKVET